MVTISVIDEIWKISTHRIHVKRRLFLVPSLFSGKSVIIVIMYRNCSSVNRNKIEIDKIELKCLWLQFCFIMITPIGRARYSRFSYISVISWCSHRDTILPMAKTRNRANPGYVRMTRYMLFRWDQPLNTQNVTCIRLFTRSCAIKLRWIEKDR